MSCWTRWGLEPATASVRVTGGTAFSLQGLLGREGRKSLLETLQKLPNMGLTGVTSWQKLQTEHGVASDTLVYRATVNAPQELKQEGVQSIVVDLKVNPAYTAEVNYQCMFQYERDSANEAGQRVQEVAERIACRAANEVIGLTVARRMVEFVNQYARERQLADVQMRLRNEIVQMVSVMG